MTYDFRQLTKKPNLGRIKILPRQFWSTKTTSSKMLKHVMQKTKSDELMTALVGKEFTCN
jgi:hypothetical protein